ncbi:MAG: spirocyclase AveC family protein [Solirubrobacteraceae bacterium]
MATTTVSRRRSPLSVGLTPVAVLASVGALLLAFQAYILIRWVTGPYFRAVPVGPSVPPTYMKVAVIGWEIVGWPLLGGCLYWFLIRPWRRERQIATDGMFCVVWCMLYFWDPVSSWGGNWFTYNSYAINRGSWVAELPWHSFARPGAMPVEGVLWALPGYGYGLFLGTFAGCWAMARVKSRWPAIGPIGLIAFCWAFMMAMDVLLEGVLWMRQGLFTTDGTGGLPTVFLGSHGNQFALSEAVFWGGAWAAISCVRFFKDDHGRTIAERGIDRLQLSAGRAAAVRLLALLGLCQLLMIAVYVIPIGVMAKIHTDVWPSSIQDKSYFNDHICGVGTHRACASG